MPVEVRPNTQNDFGSLQGCFVDGSAEQRARERRIRRRALIISIATQTALLTVIVLLPLFGKPERLTYAYVTPTPPYAPLRSHERTNTPTRPANPRSEFNPYAPPQHIPTQIDPNPPSPPSIEPGSAETWPANPCVGCIPIEDGRVQPQPPAPQRPEPPRRVVMTHLEPAMLIYRVEPMYPPLAREIRRGGRVELRAVIATDGTIQSLQVVSGEPLFLQSALAAVRQWRYRPTVLNGRPVEIDTFITVTYNLSQ